MTINFKNGETKEVEYKEEYSKSLLKTVVAFSNYNDGLIIVGIKDNGEITGLSDINRLKEKIENAISDSILPNPYYEFETNILEGKTILIIKVFKGENTPYIYKNKDYKRTDITTREVDVYEYNELILNGKNTTYDEIHINDNSLDLTILENKLKKILGITQLDTNVLTSLGLYKNDKYNIATKLLSSNNDMGKINLIKYLNNVEQIEDRIDLEKISILEQFDKTIDFYYKHVNKKEKITNAYRETIEEIPFVAYREAIANAICHRDYNKNGNIKVEIFNDRIEITSPGGLPIGISYEDFIDGKISIPRNKIIAEIFYRLKIIEKIATGIRRIKSYYKNYSSKPFFELTTNSVRVILPNVLFKKNFNLNSKENEILELLNSSNFLTAKNISDSLGLKKTQTHNYLKNLVSLGLIARVGKTRNVRYTLNS